MNDVESLRPEFERFERIALVIGVAALALCAMGAFVNRAQFFHSYLMAYLFWIGVALGCLAIVMLHHLAGGGWGFLIRRLLESGAATLPLMLVLALPLLFGIRELYPWARPEELVRNEWVQHARPYLNLPFFFVRTAFYFASWLLLGYLLNKWSLQQDRTGDGALTRRLQLMSGPGLVLYALTVTFASIDWVMSIEAHWYSTIYGMIFMVGQVLSALALVIVAMSPLAHRRPLVDLISPHYYRDLGNLMLTFVMLWAYVQFSQFLIIWSGNLPEEIPWYLRRARGSWAWIAAALLIFHFFVPFFLLLSRDIKERIRRLSLLAAAMLVVRLVDQFWLVEPAFHPEGLRVHWMDVLAPIAVGGLWVAMFLHQLKTRPLLPLHDPRLEQLEVQHG